VLPCRIACVRIGRFATGAATRRAGVGVSAGAASASAPPSPTGPPAEPPPLALVADVAGKPRVVALSREAERRGVARGMALAEARALAADLAVLPWDGEQLARAALDVTTALLAASPRVAWAGGASVPLCPCASVPTAGWGGEVGVWWVDAAGLGSEAKLARRLVRIAGALGFARARAGVAGSAITAYAATFQRHRGTGAQTHSAAAAGGRAERGDPGRRPAPCERSEPSDGRSPPFPRDAAPAIAGEDRRPRDTTPVVVPPGSDAAFLAPFPLALLEPGEDLAETCHALGLRTAGQFAALDADEVESRFGPEGLALHRLARGLDTRGPSAPRDDTLPVVACDLGSPVATAEPLLFVLKGALASLGAALRAKGLAAREVVLTLTLDDGSLAEKAVRPARPTSHEGALFDHCRAAFDDWALPEPVTALAVRAAVTVAASGEQGDLLAPRWADPAALAAAFERIRGSEGADAVATPVACDGHLPRDAGAWEEARGTEAQGHRGTDAAADRRKERGGAAGRRPAPGERSEPSDGRHPPFPRDTAPAHTGEGLLPHDAAPARGDAPPARTLTLDTPSDPPTAAALRLLHAPVPVRVRLGRAGLEAFRHGDTWHDVTAWAGPERIVPRWWVAAAVPLEGDAGGAAGPRDYYSARTADGALWLLFRAGASRQWFVEGWWD
jgi:protein ImuB